MLPHFHQYIIILGKATTLLLILICTGCFINIQFLEAANSGTGEQFTKDARHHFQQQPHVTQTQLHHKTGPSSGPLRNRTTIPETHRHCMSVGNYRILEEKTLQRPLSHSPYILLSRSHPQYSLPVPSAKHQTLIKVAFHLIQENWFRASLKQFD